MSCKLSASWSSEEKRPLNVKEGKNLINWLQGRNLVTFSATHFLRPCLNLLSLVSTLGSVVSLFHCSAPLIVKLFLASPSLWFSTMIPPLTCLLVLPKILASYSGSSD